LREVIAFEMVALGFGIANEFNGHCADDSWIVDKIEMQWQRVIVENGSKWRDRDPFERELVVHV